MVKQKRVWVICVGRQCKGFPIVGSRTNRSPISSAYKRCNPKTHATNFMLMLHLFFPTYVPASSGLNCFPNVPPDSVSFSYHKYKIVVYSRARSVTCYPSVLLTSLVAGDVVGAHRRGCRPQHDVTVRNYSQAHTHRYGNSIVRCTDAHSRSLNLA